MGVKPAEMRKNDKSGGKMGAKPAEMRKNGPSGEKTPQNPPGAREARLNERMND